MAARKQRKATEKLLSLMGSSRETTPEEKLERMEELKNMSQDDLLALYHCKRKVRGCNNGWKTRKENI